MTKNRPEGSVFPRGGRFILFLFQTVDKVYSLKQPCLCAAAAAKPPRKPYNTNPVKILDFDDRLSGGIKR